MKRAFFSGLLGLLAGLGVGVSAAFAQTLLIDELMYHPASEELSEQWLELYNPGNVPQDISGWSFTKGISYTFPAGTVVEAGSYLVVASDVEAFGLAYPDVENVVGNWSGNLSKNGEKVELANAAGVVICSVSYSNQGDWARRELTHEEIYNRDGWSWNCEHAGLGKSAELVNPRLPLSLGQNWESSRVAGGTPGRANSVSENLETQAPLLSDPRHVPVVPRSDERVNLSVRVTTLSAETPEVQVFWRANSGNRFAGVQLFDSGNLSEHGDALAGDGVFSNYIPAQKLGTVVEFYFTVRIGEGPQRVYPQVIPNDQGRSPWLVFQVDEERVDAQQTQPFLRVILPAVEYDYLVKKLWASGASDALVSGTLVYQAPGGQMAEAFYQSGFRNRGNGSISWKPHNIRIKIPRDRSWEDRTDLNANTLDVHCQVLGSVLSRMAGVPMAETRPIQVRVNGENLANPIAPQFGSYTGTEVLNGDFAERQFPLDPQGNLYRGKWHMYSWDIAAADLVWKGPDWNSYTNAYVKQNNSLENDWSDLIDLLDVLNNSTDEEYENRVRQMIDVEEWMRYFAVNTLLANQETALANGYGEDYAMYCGKLDRRFRLLSYDLDSILGSGMRTNIFNDGIWRMNTLPVVKRFITHNAFAPLYLKTLRELAEGLFAPENLNPLLDNVLGDWVGPKEVERMKAFNANQVAYVFSLIPGKFEVTSTFEISKGYPTVTQRDVVFSGKADAVRTSSVLVNGLPAQYTAWKGEWSIALNLHPGVNLLVTQAYDSEGREIAYNESYILYETGVLPNEINLATLETDMTLTAAEGPWQINSDLMIGKGVTLQIEPGTAVYFGPNVRISMGRNARILAEGTREKPIVFSGVPGGQRWRYILLNHVGVTDAVGNPENRFSYVHVKDNTSYFLYALYGSFYLDHLTFGTVGVTYLNMEGCSLMVSHCRFPGSDRPVQLVRAVKGTLQNGRAVFYRNYFGNPSGANDPADITDGPWELSPKYQLIENVFMGGGDDLLDLDGVQGWIEGNILMHAHKDKANTSLGGASAISGGRDESGTGSTANHYIVGNLFYDVDHAVKAKDGNFHVIAHNTVVIVTPEGGIDTDCGMLGCGDIGYPESLGHYLRDNIFYDIQKLLREHKASVLTFEGNLMQEPWGPELVAQYPWARGGNNSASDPGFIYVPELEETLHFQTWDQAQIMKEWFSLREDSPARGTGVNGRDKGFTVERGVSISGEPEEIRPNEEITLTIGASYNDFGVEVPKFPQGAGYLAYCYRINHNGEFGQWSPEYPITEPLTLSLAEEGTYFLEVSGKKHIGMWDHDPRMGQAMSVARSRSWEVRADASPILNESGSLRLNELLFDTGYIELFNAGTENIQLETWSLTDHPSIPGRVAFLPGSVLSPGEYLLVEVGMDLPLSLEGGNIYLMRDEEPVDQVSYGAQIRGHTLGRVNANAWSLCSPTPAAPNIAVKMGEPSCLKINEWLAREQSVFGADFVELFNPSELPVNLGGLYLSDATAEAQLFAIAPHTFIAPGGYTLFIADGAPEQGANHLSFKLSSSVGSISLFDSGNTRIDSVVYYSEREDISSGRSPDGSARICALSAPTPGSPNSVILSQQEVQIETTELVPMDASWRYDQSGTDLGTDWRNSGYDDQSWPQGLALFYNEIDPLPGPTNTKIKTGMFTHYFRTTFTVDEATLSEWREPGSRWVLNLNTIYDDGLVFYLNGVEVLRLNMPNGNVNYLTTALPGEGRLNGPYEIALTNLMSGLNTFAVELHQNTKSSSDAVMGAELLVERYTPHRVSLLARPRFSEVFAASQYLSLDGEYIFDWVELYNPEDEIVDLSGMVLTTKKMNGISGVAPEDYFVFPESTQLQPGAYLVIACSEDGLLGAASFNLSAEGGTLYLYDSTAAGAALVDSVTYGFQIKDLSISRVDFFRQEWQLSHPTPGEPHEFCKLGSAADVFINEWMASPLNGGDWFELYNAGELPVDLSLHYLSDDPSRFNQYRIPQASYLGAGAQAWIKIMADEELEKGAHHVNFKLSSSGEEIILSSPQALFLDVVSFGTQKKGISQGRYPDGSPTLYPFELPTPGARNIKEMPPEDQDTDGDRMPDLWELNYRFDPYDPSDAALDADGDRMSNLGEYLAGTDPRDPTDYLCLHNVRVERDGAEKDWVVMDLQAVQGRSYRVEFYRNPEAGWQLFREIPAVTQDGLIELKGELEEAGACYYRVLIPVL